MEAAAARECTASIMEDHNISGEMSRDVREALEGVGVESADRVDGGEGSSSAACMGWAAM
jgi:hypothetical protein